MKYAIVDANDVVLNVIEISNGNGYPVPPGCTLVPGRDWPPPAPTPFTPLTLDQVYDQAIQTQQVLKALVLALNDGSLPVGTNKTGAQLKAIVKARM